MSTALGQPQTPPEPSATGSAARGSLLRAEALRLRSRRTVRVLLGLAVLGFLAGIVLGLLTYAEPSAAALAEAEQRRRLIVTESEGYRAQCLRDVGTPNGPPTGADCPPVQAAGDYPLESFMDKRPFTLTNEGRGGVLGVAAATAALAFLLGATYVGAEWSTRSMVALLFWEPRRARVMATKLAVLAAAAALLGAVAAGAWLLTARVLAEVRGTPAAPPGLWRDMLASAGRGVLLVVLMALLGFGVANLFRSTAAALGVGFLYFAVVESAVRGLRPAWGQWLLAENAGALVNTGGLGFTVYERVRDEQGVYEAAGREILLSNLRGGLLVAAATAVVVAAGVALFARRDLD